MKRLFRFSSHASVIRRGIVLGAAIAAMWLPAGSAVRAQQSEADTANAPRKAVVFTVDVAEDLRTRQRGSTGGEEGSYAIAGTALTMTPDGGNPETVSAFPFGEDVEGARPEWIVFGGLLLKRAA